MIKKIKQKFINILKDTYWVYKSLKDYYQCRIYRQIWRDVQSEIDYKIWMKYGQLENSVIYVDSPEMSPLRGPMKVAHVEFDPVFGQMWDLQTQLRHQIIDDGAHVWPPSPEVSWL